MLYDRLSYQYLPFFHLFTSDKLSSADQAERIILHIMSLNLHETFRERERRLCINHGLIYLSP